MTIRARHPMPAILAQLPGDRHVVIEASAGTGKTFTLEHLVVARILAGVPITELLVVTFTDKAALELRERIRALIAKLTHLPDGAGGDVVGPSFELTDAARGLLRSALRDFDGATLATIHSFCTRVIREHAFAAQRLFGERFVKGKDAFEAAFALVLREELARDPEHRRLLDAWLSSGKSAEQLCTLLFSCASANAAIAPPDDLEGIRGNVERCRAFVEALPSWPVGRAAKRFQNRCAVLLPALDAAARAPDLLGVIAALSDLREKTFATDAGTRSCLRELIDILRDSPRAAQEPEVLEALEALDDAIPSLASTTAARFTPLIEARLEAQKREQGLFDFDDLLRGVRDALEGPSGPPLTEALRARYREVLIDEFQDTDEVQWSIFRKLFFEEGHGRIVVIGDPKQAIYAFRGANVATYLRAREELRAAGGVLVTLADNYRSSAALIDAYNRILAGDAAASYFTGPNAYDVPVRCGKAALRLVDEAGGPASPLHLFEVEAPPAKPELCARLGARIAHEIQQLLDPKAPLLRFDDGDGPKPLAARDIFVLAAKRVELQDLGDELRRAGVPIAFYKLGGLLSTDEARHVEDLLAAIAEPDEPSRCARAWLTPFFGLTLGELPGAAEAPASHPLRRRLLDWKRLADERRYEELFPRLLADSGLVQRELFLDDDERALTNYLHLFELLLERAGGARADLRELVQFLQRGRAEELEADEDDRFDLQRLPTERDAVQLMTFHASKGLEAKVVFVAGMPGGPKQRGPTTVVPGEAGGRLIYPGAPPQPIVDRRRQEDRYEHERLLYVALTRAKGRIYLPFYGASAVETTYAPVHDRLVALSNDGGASGWTREALEPVTADPAGARVPIELDSIELPPSLLEPVSSEPLRRLHERHAGRRVVSYSRLAAEEKRARGEASAGEPVPGRDEAASSGGVGRDELPGSAALGVFLHEVIARMPPASVFTEESAEAFAARPEVARTFAELRHLFPLDERYLPAARRLVFLSLRAPVRLEAGRVIEGIGSATRLLRETEFLYPIPEADHPPLAAGGRIEVRRGFVKGFIDVLFEHEGRAYVANWKSDLLPDYAPRTLAAHVEAHYALQLRLYLLALARMLRVQDEADYEARVGGAIYLFLRGMELDGAGERGAAGVEFVRPSFSELVTWERELTARTGREDAA